MEVLIWNPGDRNTQALVHDVEEFDGAAVDVVHGDDAITGPADRKRAGKNGRHAARCDDASGAVFECCDLLLSGCDGGIAVARVVEALGASTVDAAEFIDARDDKDGCLRDVRSDGSGEAVAVFAGMDTSGGKRARWFFPGRHGNQYKVSRFRCFKVFVTDL